MVGDVFHAARQEKHLFLNPALPDWMVVNESAAYVLFRCDGTRTLDEVRTHVLGLGGRQAEVDLLIDRAIHHGILEDGTAAPIMDATSSPGPEVSPSLRTVHLKLTGDCNLRCRYCYAESGSGGAMLSFAELLDLARQVREISPSVAWVLSGGEPLLHPGCLDFAEAMRDRGDAVHLLTNGTLIDREAARRIAETCGLVKISVDGLTEETHARTRGGGHHARVVRAIDGLIAAGAPVRIAMTVTRENVGDIKAMAERYGDRLSFQPFFHAGHGRTNPGLALDGDEYYEALSRAGVRPMGQIARILARARRRGIGKCALADAEIAIAETGAVYPCHMLEDREFEAGNIRNLPLAEIYERSAVLMRFRHLGTDVVEKCTDCPVRRICGGACRARTWHECGRMDVAGAFCAYERRAFIQGIFDTTEFA